jgi:hypothetical protein
MEAPSSTQSQRYRPRDASALGSVPAGALGRSASEPPQDESEGQSAVQWRGARPLRTIYQSAGINGSHASSSEVQLNRTSFPGSEATSTPLIGRRRFSNRSSATPLRDLRVPSFSSNAPSLFRNSTGTMPDNSIIAADSLAADNHNSDDGSSIPDTITTNTPRRRPKASNGTKSASEDGAAGSQYTYASDWSASKKEGSPPWSVSREVLERDFMFRP